MLSKVKQLQVLLSWPVGLSFPLQSCENAKELVFRAGNSTKDWTGSNRKHCFPRNSPQNCSYKLYCRQNVNIPWYCLKVRLDLKRKHFPCYVLCFQFLYITGLLMTLLSCKEVHFSECGLGKHLFPSISIFWSLDKYTMKTVKFKTIRVN